MDVVSHGWLLLVSERFEIRLAADSKIERCYLIC